MSKTKQWSREWKSSKKPSKQRKYRSNAPHHHRKTFLNAHLSSSVREKMGARTVPLRTGDRVEVMRGDHAGKDGRVENIDTEEKKVYVDGIEREAVDGSDVTVPLRPSNLKITKLNLDDDLRVEKYEVTEAEKEEISVDMAEPDEEDGGADEEINADAGTETEDVAEETDEEEDSVDTEETAADDTDYEDAVSGTIDDVKEAVEDGLDPEQVLEAEKANKDRVTLVDWLERKIDGDSDE